jgi:dihydrodipicolinate synthase/N-acetylneuraminate lyase
VAKYEKGDARSWARATLQGCCGCVMPTFTADVRGLNEAAIRHDVAHEKALGMRCILIVSEGGTTSAEMHRFIGICVDEAGEDLVTIVQASEPTFADMVEVMHYAEGAGVDLVLPSYPLTYHPMTLDQIFEDTKRLIDSTWLGVMIFAIDQWNFSRLHPAAFPISLLERLVEECPNLAGIKNEVGVPYAGGLVDVFEKFGSRVVVTDPFEHNAPIWIKHYGMRYLGTSNYEAMGDGVPRMLTLLSDPATWDEGMELYWKLAPVRRANSAVASATVTQTQLVPRAVWKYQGWLVGFNGGPLRAPQQRITAAQMGVLRAAANAAGLQVTSDPDELFWVGRNPG